MLSFLCGRKSVVAAAAEATGGIIRVLPGDTAAVRQIASEAARSTALINEREKLAKKKKEKRKWQIQEEADKSSGGSITPPSRQCPPARLHRPNHLLETHPVNLKTERERAIFHIPLDHNEPCKFRVRQRPRP